MVFVRSSDADSMEFLQKGASLVFQESWILMTNTERGEVSWVDNHKPIFTTTLAMAEALQAMCQLR